MNFLSLPLSLALLAPHAGPQEITRTVGQLTLAADPSYAWPGGVLLVRLRRSLGTTYAIVHGRRAPFFDTARGPLAVVPIPVTDQPGPTTLGIELIARNGRQRIAVDMAVASHSYAPGRTVEVPEVKRALFALPEAVVDGRRLLGLLRTLTPQASWSVPFSPPAVVPITAGFGVAETYAGGGQIEWIEDGVWGRYHHGVDYAVALGTLVQAPAAGTVLYAGPLTLTGQTVLIDHGQGLISALCHLSRVDVHEGDRVEARAPVGLSGDTGIASGPQLHWAVYVHGVPVDPEIFLKLRE